MSTPEEQPEPEKTQSFGSLRVPERLLRKAKLIAAIDGVNRNTVLTEAIKVGLEHMGWGLEERVQRYLAGEGEDTDEPTFDELNEPS